MGSICRKEIPRLLRGSDESELIGHSGADSSVCSHPPSSPLHQIITETKMQVFFVVLFAVPNGFSVAF